MKPLATLLLMLLPAVASATQDRWPALFDVTGVAADDVLNLRAGPGAEHPVVGTLAPDATGIEVVRPNDRETWGLVNVGETSGWASLAYLRRGPGQWLGATVEAARCAGTEPFWGFDFDAGGAVRWSEPGTEPTGGRILERLPSTSVRDQQGLTFRMDGRDMDGVGVLVLGSCSDGMSDREYGIRLHLVLGTTAGARLYSGCCSLVP